MKFLAERKRFLKENSICYKCVWKNVGISLSVTNVVFRSFGIYHPQKLGKIRIVFDSSAQYNNISLNQVLLITAL